MHVLCAVGGRYRHFVLDEVESSVFDQLGLSMIIPGPVLRVIRVGGLDSEIPERAANNAQTLGRTEED